MKHYLFEFLQGDYEGEEILIGGKTLEDAEAIARLEFGEGLVKYTGCALTDEEAETWGIDEL